MTASGFVDDGPVQTVIVLVVVGVRAQRRCGKDAKDKVFHSISPKVRFGEGHPTNAAGFGQRLNYEL